MAAKTCAMITLDDLSPDHLHLFTRTFSRVILADATRLVLAQIIDGNPVREVTFDYAYSHPICEDHGEPPHDSMEIARAVQDSFQVELLEIDSKLAQAYQNTVIGSREFKLRLLEMTATALHSTAALLYHRTKHMHEHWRGCDQDLIPPTNLRPPTPLLHLEYMDNDQYPLGVADMVGYWAEQQVFGGVVLFNRGESEVDAIDAYIHPAAPFLIYKLSDIQLETFVESASSPEARPLSLPFRTEKYALRVHPDESMARHTFRDKYERRLPQGNRPGYHRRTRLEDEPEMMDLLKKLRDKENGVGSRSAC